MLRKDCLRPSRKSKLTRHALVFFVVLTGVTVCGFRLRATGQSNEQLIYPHPGAPESEAEPANLDDTLQEKLPAILSLRLKPSGEELELEMEQALDADKLRKLVPQIFSEKQLEKLLEQLDEPLRNMLTEYSANEPHTYEVTALFRAAANPTNLLGDVPELNEHEWKLFCKTQLALIKSDFVIRKALQDPSINQLSIVREQNDPVAWLVDSLDVEFLDNSEILRIRLPCAENEVEQTRQLVDAVAAAYTNKVLYADRKIRLSTLDVLQKALSQLNGEIRSKMEDYEDLAIELGLGDHGASRLQQELELRRLDRIEDMIWELRKEQRVAKRQLRSLQRSTNPQSEPAAKRQLSSHTALVEALTEELQDLQIAREEQEKQLTSINESSVELLVREQELEQLKNVAHSMATKIERARIELQVPARIVQIQSAQSSQLPSNGDALP